MKNYLSVVVTGDVDSGKSTLIGRFLYEMGSLSKGVIEEIRDVCQKLEGNFEFAYLLDSLEEERRNQLTIDTTQVFCKTKIGKEFVFIDVPGHKELLKNMLCGSSYADIAILVVDVRKSIEQQTRRHAFILKFLGIDQIIVVLNKMDLVGFDEIIFNKVKNEIVDFSKKTGLPPKYIIPTSANRGENLIKMSKKMSWYKRLSLLEALNTCFKKHNNGPFRFPIQDIYNLGKEKIAVGRIISGEIKKGQNVWVLPLNKELKLNTIIVFKKNKFKARAPQSIGLRLNRMDNISRGDVICKLGLPSVSTRFLIKVFCVRNLDIKKKFTLHCATQETFAWISQINNVWDTASFALKPKKMILEESELTEATIVTENPLVIESFQGRNSLGRFVLQDDNEICAIGIIP